MAWFGRNPNETAYVGGKKHWTDVIKNSGSSDLLIWRQPEEDFNTNSTLIVMPGEAAIFVNGGVIESVFNESGTYKLSTENYPFISRLRNAFSGGISTFNCVVYFVRTAHSMEILWGTPTPIQVRDPIHRIFCNVQARGAYKIQVADPSKFLMYMVGNNVQAVNQDDLRKYFGSQMMMYIKSYITQFINCLTFWGHFIMDGLFFDIPFGPYMIVYFVSIDILMSGSYNRCINQFVYTCRHSRINCNFMCRSSFRSNEWHGDQNNCIRIFKCFRQFFRIVKIGNSGFNAHCLVFFKTIFCWSRKNQSFMRISFQQYTG